MDEQQLRQTIRAEIESERREKIAAFTYMQSWKRIAVYLISVAIVSVLGLLDLPVAALLFSPLLLLGVVGVTRSRAVRSRRG